MVNKEKIEAVMKGLEGIKNNFFETELEFAKEQYELSDEEKEKLEELESPKSPKNKPKNQR